MDHEREDTIRPENVREGERLVMTRPLTLAWSAGYGQGARDAFALMLVTFAFAMLAFVTFRRVE